MEKLIGLEVVTSEKYNTNNAWGFGGSYGTRTTYSNGLMLTKGKYCYRHLKASPFTKYHFKLGDVVKEVNGKVVNGNNIYLYECGYADETVKSKASFIFSAKDKDECKKLFDKNVNRQIYVVKKIKELIKL